MKRFVVPLALIAAIAFSSSLQAAEPGKVIGATPEDCIRIFYKWYVTNLVANRDPMKQRAEIRRYATERLLKEIDKVTKGPDGLDGDYFVDAQDFDPLWAKNISISAVKITGDQEQRKSASGWSKRNAKEADGISREGRRNLESRQGPRKRGHRVTDVVC
jgi:hypothetical protein